MSLSTVVWPRLRFTGRTVNMVDHTSPSGRVEGDLFSTHIERALANTRLYGVQCTHVHDVYTVCPTPPPAPPMNLKGVNHHGAESD